MGADGGKATEDKGEGQKKTQSQKTSKTISKSGRLDGDYMERIMVDQRTSKDLYQHSDTGKFYAVERLWSGGIVGSAGPLPENDLRSLDDYEYTPERNNWLKDANDKLILI